MSASNDRQEEAKQLFAHLALTTNNLTKLDTLIILLLGFKLTQVEYRCVPQHSYLVGGILLQSIGLALEFIEFIRDSFYYLIETLNIKTISRNRRS